MKYLVTIGSDTLEVDIEQRRDGTYLVRQALGAPLEVCLTDTKEPGLLHLLVDGQTVVAQPADAELRYRQERYTARAQNARDRAASAAVSGDSAQARRVLASMPGRIVRVLCQPGTPVLLGAPLVVIEAMKMQNELCAKSDAVVRAVHVVPGQTVERGTLLVELE